MPVTFLFADALFPAEAFPPRVLFPLAASSPSPPAPRCLFTRFFGDATAVTFTAAFLFPLVPVPAARGELSSPVLRGSLGLAGFPGDPRALPRLSVAVEAGGCCDAAPRLFGDPEGGDVLLGGDAGSGDLRRTGDPLGDAAREPPPGDRAHTAACRSRTVNRRHEGAPTAIKRGVTILRSTGSSHCDYSCMHREQDIDR